MGTHGRFKESMQTALSKHPELRALTRDPEDATLALFDGWATVLDVLGFYQERIANEGYIRTATERDSVLQLARRLGYELAPGVAAETHLAFALENAPEAPSSVKIVEGTKVQSVPGQDELPQTFETVEEIEARPIWNELKPRLSEEQLISEQEPIETNHLYLSGSDLDLTPGDPILVVESGGTRKLLTIEKVESDPDPVLNRTGIELSGTVISGSTQPEVYAFGVRASLFGYNAPHAAALPTDPFQDNGLVSASPPHEWLNFSLGTDDPLTSLNLDRVYPEILAGSWIVLIDSADNGTVAVRRCDIYIGRKPGSFRAERKDHQSGGRRADQPFPG